MPHLIIDDRAIVVPEGTMVIEAAERLGIMIPRFCYLKALGSVGACRMCAVSFLAGPVTGVQMSCMVAARDGMVVSTTDPKAVDFRRQVIEWLMANHPHDCPVCDEGGHCLLQDETISGGHGIRRYPGRKRTYRDQDLGPFIQHEMNRCIHCYRCARFYQEYGGYRDFGALQIGSRMYFGRFTDGTLESPFSGNLIDICPTGVFTDKTARYKQRPWDLEQAPSLCLNCSLGCNITAHAAYRALVLLTARENERVNGPFICDRGRFGGFYANHPQRPWHPTVERKEVAWDQAMSAMVAGVEKVVQASGPGAVALLGSTRASMETMGQLHHLSHLFALRGPHFFVEPALERKVARAIARLDQRVAISLSGIERADCILLVGADPINEAPMLGLAIRQAARRGAMVVVIDPRPVTLPCAFTHLPVTTGEMERCLAALVHQAIKRERVEELAPSLLPFFAALAPPAPRSPATPAMAEQAARMMDSLSQSKLPVLVCGTEIVRGSTPDFVADLALLLRATQGACGLFPLLPGANAYGAALLTERDQPSFQDTVAAIESGAVKAVIAVEADPFRSYPDRRRLKKALAGLELIITLDYLPGDLLALAHISLPTATVFEAGGHFINQEGRVQVASPVQSGGQPLAQLSGGGHPPRLYAREATGEAPRPAGQILRELTEAISRDSGPVPIDSFWRLIAAAPPALPLPQQAGYPVDGETMIPSHPEEGTARLIANGPAREERRHATLELVLTDLTFGTEELSSYSEPLLQAVEPPRVLLHPEEAGKVGVKEGDRVRVHLDQGVLELPVALSSTMAQGVLILPRHHLLRWQQLQAEGAIPFCRVEKI